MKKSVLCLLALSAPLFAYSQNSPVTVAESNAVINKVDAAMRNTLGMKPGKPLPTKESRLVTRAEVVKSLDVLFESYRPYFQFTPRPHRAEGQVIEKFNSDKQTRDLLHKFIKFGCCSAVSPLVVGPGANISVADFGDAIGYFAAQIAAVTYFADPLYVPNLQKSDVIGG